MSHDLSVRSRSIIFLILTLMTFLPAIAVMPLPSFLPHIGEAKATGVTVLGIWSDQYKSRSIVDTAIKKNDIVTVSVNVTNAGPPQVADLLNGFDISVRIDPLVLTNTTVKPAAFTGGLFAACPNSPCFPLKNEFNSATGTVRVAVVVLGSSASGPSGMLFSFQLKVLTTGQSNIDIVQSVTFLTNPTSVGYVPLSGFFSNTGVHEVSVQSVNAAPEQVVKGDNATLTVVVANLGAFTETAVTVSINVTGVLPRILASVASKAIVPVNFSWNTTSMAPGVYLINATATIVSGDAFPGDNSLAVEQITVVAVDLAVTSITPASNSVTRTQRSLSVSVNVTNYGSITSRANVTLYGNRTLANEVKIGNVAQDVQPGKTVTLYPTFAWNVTLAPFGNYTLSATVLPVQGEKNTTNNNLPDGTVTVLLPQKDVGLISISILDTTTSTPLPPFAAVGDIFNFTVKAMNEGTKSATFKVFLLRNNTVILPPSNETLSPGSSITKTYQWDTIGTAPGLYEFSGNVTLSGDENLLNNQLPVSQTVTFYTNHKPVVRFQFSPSVPNPGQSVKFDATSTSDPDTAKFQDQVVHYVWNFGDGGTSVETTNLPSHTYTTAGTYTVTLTVADLHGATNSTSKTIRINAAPTSTFTVSSSSPTTGQIVTFDASASKDSDGNVAKYVWDFGDGSKFNATSALTTHTYLKAGNYKVTLTVIDNDGVSTASTPQTIVVSESPSSGTGNLPIIIGGGVGGAAAIAAAIYLLRRRKGQQPTVPSVPQAKP